MGTTYLLNTPVLTDYGRYRFEGPLGVEEAKGYLADGFTSAIGHAGAATFLGRLLGMEVPHQRITIRMAPGDRAVVVRIAERLPEGAMLSDDELARIPVELGLLTRE